MARPPLGRVPPVRVLGVWRYPVKSMQGQALDEVVLGPLGVGGDRSHAVVDVATGLVLTARRAPALLQATGCRRVDGTVEVVLPDGRVAGGDEGLSDWLGRPVRLGGASAVCRPRYESADADDATWRRWDGPAGAFHDANNVRVSILGAGTVASLGRWDVRRFRPNLVVDGEGEDALIGRRVRVGGAVLTVVEPVPRCVMVTRPQPGGIDRDLDVLRTILRQRAGLLAVGAVVLEPGPVAVGATVEVLG